MSTRIRQHSVSSTEGLWDKALPCPRSWVIVVFGALALLGTWCTQAVAQDDLTSLSIEELLNVEVTSVSKTVERRSAAAAAIYVLTAEDIRRSGARTLPDVLRTVPGLSVAQISGNKWSVTSRGFGGRFANKLLVMIDGRSIYTPQFSGVLWEMHDVRLEDIDRIEVIRGPGGTLWGANAVNGVINIVTKSAKDTQGGQVTAGVGNVEQGFGSVRYGGSSGDNLYYRAYVQAFNRDPGGDTPLGADADDDWAGGSAGFRLDWNLSDRDTLALSSGVTHVRPRTEVMLPDPVGPAFAVRADGRDTLQNRYLLGQWTRTLSDDSDFHLQFYYDYYQHEQIFLDETHHTLDLEFQHRITLGDRHGVIWGGRVRHHVDDFDNTTFVTYPDSSRNDHLYSIFAQDTFTINDQLKLIFGAKLEYNTFSELEFQPNLRFAWTPDERQTLWGAVSRAVRTPSRAEHDISLLAQFLDTGLGTTAATFTGTHDYKSEDLTAFELGYRRALGDTLFIDIAGFYNIYDDLRTIRIGDPTTLPEQVPGFPVIPALIENESDGITYGLEIVADWRPKSWWQLQAGYSYLYVDIDLNPGASAAIAEHDTPEHQAYLRSRWNLPKNVDLDATLRYVDELRSFDIDEYVELDLRVAWRPKDDLELALVGRNLLDSAHFEANDSVLNFIRSEVTRSVYFMVTWEF